MHLKVRYKLWKPLYYINKDTTYKNTGIFYIRALNKLLLLRQQWRFKMAVKLRFYRQCRKRVWLPLIFFMKCCCGCTIKLWEKFKGNQYGQFLFSLIMNYKSIWWKFFTVQKYLETFPHIVIYKRNVWWNKVWGNRTCSWDKWKNILFGSRLDL